MRKGQNAPRPLFVPITDHVLFANPVQHNLVLNCLYTNTSPNSPKQGYIHHKSLQLYTNPSNRNESTFNFPPLRLVNFLV